MPVLLSRVPSGHITTTWTVDLHLHHAVLLAINVLHCVILLALL